MLELKSSPNWSFWNRVPKWSRSVGLNILFAWIIVLSIIQFVFLLYLYYKVFISASWSLDYLVQQQFLWRTLWRAVATQCKLTLVSLTAITEWPRCSRLHLFTQYFSFLPSAHSIATPTSPFSPPKDTFSPTLSLIPPALALTVK